MTRALAQRNITGTSPADIPSAEDMYDDEAIWIAAGAGEAGSWPWRPVSYVYFLQGQKSGLIRIGKAKNVWERFSAHKSSSAEPLIQLGDMPGGITLERQFHTVFKPFRHKGSWYRPDKSLLDTIWRVVDL